MIKKIKILFVKIFGIKQCSMSRRHDEHAELYLKTPEPDVPVHKPEHCPSHLRFRKSCLACQEIVA